MIFKLTLTVGLIIILVAFFAEYMDSTMGMGYGTMLAPVLLILGYSPLQVVPALLLSEFITGMLAGFTHHFVGNVDFRPRTMNVIKIAKALREYGPFESFRRGLPLPLKIAILIGVCSVVGTVSAVLIAVRIPPYYLKLAIGIMIFLIGVVIIATIRREYHFSWKRVVALGVIASFNKGLSGGGYGPVVTGGQLLAGVDGKNAVAITSLAEGLTCLTGVLMYFFSGKHVDWVLAPYLLIGAILSVPLSAITVRKMNTKILKMLIGIVTVILGCLTLFKVLF